MYQHFEFEMEIVEKRIRHRKRLELADPYFLTYQRLRPINSVEIHFEILTCPFQTKAGGFIV